MPLQIRCPGCKGAFRIKDEYAGKAIKCPKCAWIVRIPVQANHLDMPGAQVEQTEQLSPEERLRGLEEKIAELKAKRKKIDCNRSPPRE